jgi:TonB family protein
MPSLRFIAAFGFILAALPVAPCVRAGPGGLDWKHFERPVFPQVFTGTTITDGYAVVVFTFDETGRITDRIALEASHPAFVMATFDALRASTLDASAYEAHKRREVMRFEFRRTGVVVNKTHRDATKAAFTVYGDTGATSIPMLEEHELQPPLRRLEGSLPRMPDALRGQGLVAEPVVEFVVDAEGRVRVPLVVTPVDEALAEAVVEAVSSWRFEPPRVDSVPVQVAVRRTFRFGRN